MTPSGWIDLIIVLVVVVAVSSGLRQGAVASALAFFGVVLGAVAIFEGKPPPYAEFVRLVASRLERVPRYRQRLMHVPLDIGRPVWVDESDLERPSFEDPAS